MAALRIWGGRQVGSGELGLWWHPYSSNRLMEPTRKWHFRDIARSGTNVCFRRKSGHVADITTMTGFDPERTLPTRSTTIQNNSDWF